MNNPSICRFPAPRARLFLRISLAACAPPLTTEEGSLIIRLAGGSGAARASVEEIVARLSYQLEFSGPGGETLSRTAEPGAGSLTLSLSPGDWTIGAAAHLPDGTLYGTGGTSVTVSPGRINEADLAMYPVDMSVLTLHVSGSSSTPPGNDSTGDGTEGNPFATMAKALEVIGDKYAQPTWPGKNSAYVSPAEILVTGTITTEGSSSSNGMVDITDTGFSRYTEYPPIILKGGTGGGTLKANSLLPPKRVLYINNANVTLEAGLILTGGDTGYGGGVYVANGTFTMRGGEIDGNTASQEGGGVYVASGTFTMNGGTISNNTATYGDGGGVYVPGSFTMSGGTISGNQANNIIGEGGGVYVMNGNFAMSGDANIRDNKASSGGGVCVDGAG
ncbi:MAG: right-handed parallel beta-helix repeat-containing protein, partial [Treponema sp.]|nr:right-handed parallel beta-helix repeat-containing protein [Treponema sp.]